LDVRGKGPGGSRNARAFTGVHLVSTEAVDDSESGQQEKTLPPAIRRTREAGCRRMTSAVPAALAAAAWIRSAVAAPAPAANPLRNEHGNRGDGDLQQSV
jgi:hypothetical protein